MDSKRDIRQRKIYLQYNFNVEEQSDHFFFKIYQIPCRNLLLFTISNYKNLLISVNFLRTLSYFSFIFSLSLVVTEQYSDFG